VGSQGTCQPQLPSVSRSLPLLLLTPRLLCVCLCVCLLPTGMPPDANAGRIWVESADSGRWRLLLRPQQLDQLKQVLEPRGAREGGLHAALLRVEGAVRAAMPGQPFHMPSSLGGSLGLPALTCVRKEEGGLHSCALL
jgi:hypothetical protein